MTKQLDFYFSDSNYPKDKFILELANADGGWVPVDVFLKFNKIKKFTGDVNVVEKCFRKCKLVEVSEDGKKVKRLGNLLVDPQVLELRTVHAYGFTSKKFVNKVEVEKAFTVYGKVNSVWYIKKDRIKKKRSVYIEFDSEDSAKKALEAGTFNYKHEGKEYPITIISKKDYMIQVEEQEKKNEKHKNKKRKRDESETHSKTLTPGLLLKILNDPKELLLPQETYKHGIIFLKQTLSEYGKVGYVEMNDGICIIRFHEAPSAQNALKAFVEEKKKIREKEINAVIMEGEEEKKYWDDNILNRPVNNYQQKKKQRRYN